MASSMHVTQRVSQHELYEDPETEAAKWNFTLLCSFLSLLKGHSSDLTREGQLTVYLSQEVPLSL